MAIDTTTKLITVYYRKIVKYINFNLDMQKNAVV